MDDNFLMVWIESVSDVTSDDLLAARKFDSQSIYLLYEYATQLPQALKPGKECKSMEVMLRASNLRHEQCGSMLKHFKKVHGFDINNPQVVFKPGCYEPEWAPFPPALLGLIDSLGNRLQGDGR